MATVENGNGIPFQVTLRELPLPVRLVLSLFLLAVGLGYFSALVQLHFQNATRGEPLPTPDDVVEIFSGVTNWSGAKPTPPPPVSKMERLVTAPESLPHNGSGTMSFAFFGKKLPPAKRPEREGEQLAVQAWIDAPEAERKAAYDDNSFTLPESLADHPITKDFKNGDKIKIQSLIQGRCGKCHEEEGLEGKTKLLAYADFADVLTVPPAGKTSRQISLEHLTETTHLHLLSFCVLWTLTGLIFAFSSYPRWFRCILGPIVLLAQVADVSCWWLARLEGVGPYFALAIIGTGSVVGLGLGLQIVLSLFNMYRLRGKVVLLLLFGAAAAGAAWLDPHVMAYLNQEKAPTLTAPAAPTNP